MMHLRRAGPEERMGKADVRLSCFGIKDNPHGELFQCFVTRRTGPTGSYAALANHGQCFQGAY